MKRVLFLRSLTNQERVTNEDWAQLSVAVQEYMHGDVQVEAALLSELAFLVDGRKSRIWHPKQGWDVADFDLVIFRRVGDELEKASGIAYYLQSKHVPFIDHYILRPGKGKLSGAFLRAGNSIPVPRTFYAAAEVYGQLFKDEPILDYPFVLKADNGRKGRDNYLIHSYQELLEVLDKSKHLDMIAQEFIPNDGDLRVLMLNDTPRLVIKRKGKAGSHLNNTSQGGTAAILPVNTLSAEVLADCKRAAQLEELQVAGVDVIIDKVNGRHYFLEVNRAPQVATGAFTKEKLNAYAAMVKELLEVPVQHKALQSIGRVENVRIGGSAAIPARIDTGAKTSAIWASNVYEDSVAGLLHFTLFDTQSEYYTNKTITASVYKETVVSSSNGVAEKRYVVKLPVYIAGRKVYASMTLADRSTQVYPILIGRNILRGKFIVDVQDGSALRYKEKKRTAELRASVRE